MSTGDQKVQEKEKQVPQQLNLQTDRMSELQSAISDLEERLHPLLRSPEPQTDAESTEPAQLCDFAEKMREVNWSIEEAGGRIMELLDRLEI